MDARAQVTNDDTAIFEHWAALNSDGLQNFTHILNAVAGLEKQAKVIKEFPAKAKVAQQTFDQLNDDKKFFLLKQEIAKKIAALEQSEFKHAAELLLAEFVRYENEQEYLNYLISSMRSLLCIFFFIAGPERITNSSMLKVMCEGMLDTTAEQLEKPASSWGDWAIAFMLFGGTAGIAGMVLTFLIPANPITGFVALGLAIASALLGTLSLFMSLFAFSASTTKKNEPYVPLGNKFSLFALKLNEKYFPDNSPAAPVKNEAETTDATPLLTPTPA